MLMDTNKIDAKKIGGVDNYFLFYFSGKEQP